MGTVHRLPAAQSITLGEAVSAYLASIPGAEKAGTRKQYAAVLRLAREHFGAGVAAGELDPATVAQWFTGRWEDCSPSRWNTARAALRAASGYWQKQGWASADLTSQIGWRRVVAARDRALSRAQIEELLTREDVPIRERTLWRMLYETAARSAEVLSLDVEDLDLPNRRATVTRKGGARDVIVWQTGTARLLPRLLRGRKSGPVFVTERKARVELPASDLDPSGHARLSLRAAQELFKAASGGKTLHQLRHSALTHDAEEGASTSMLMARSGHTTVRSLARYARVSAEALQRHQEERDPARRKR